MTTKRGFTLTRREIVLRFADDSQLDGLEVTAKLDVSLSRFLEFQSAIGNDGAEDPGTEGLRDAFTLFATEILLGWNLQDDEGRPIEPSVAACFDLPPSACSSIMTEWSAAVSEPDPLPVTTSSSTKLLDPVKEEETES